MRQAISLSALLFCLLIPCVHAQQPAVLATPLPSDPAAMLALAAKYNGLDSPEMKPWYLKASYEVYGADGSPGPTNDFEEWWEGPKEYKQLYERGGTTQAEYVTEKGAFRTGGKQPIPYPDSIIAMLLLHPLPYATEIAAAKLEERQQDFGKAKLSCAILSQRIVGDAYPPFGLFPAFCFNRQNAILRFSAFSGGLQVLYNKNALFQGRVFAQEIAVFDNGKPVIKIHVQSVRSLLGSEKSVLDPPADVHAVKVGLIRVSGAVTDARLVRKVAPNYPHAAEAMGISGTVVLDAVIGTDGRIHDLKVIKSPDPSLSLSALEAAYQWVYQPYILNGEPVSVHTTLQVIFKLRR